MKKLLTLVLALVLCFSATFAVACGGSGSGSKGGIEVDESKTQLYVGNYNGGYGSVWFDARIKAFETKYANESFEENKMGVQIIPTKNKTTMTGKNLLNDMTQNDVLFTEAVYYYEFLEKDLLLDITDVVTSTNEQGKEGDQASIESKINQTQKDYLNSTASGNKYYAVPHYASFAGLMYDADLFKAKGFYMTDNGTFLQTYNPANLGVGPDGVKGSHDDGLPKTYDQFFALCDKMIKSECIPFAWNYNVAYINWLLGALHADYEGIDQMRLLFDYNYKDAQGNPVKAKNLISVSDSGVITPKGEMTISNANGYEMYSQAGRYYALNFLDRMLSKESYYHSDSGTTTFSHTLAQGAFLLDSIDNDNLDVAMLVEGIWWEEEASADFAYAAKTYGEEYSRKNRDIRYMPLPKATSDKIGQKTTLLDLGKSFAFINASAANNPVRLDLAKKFLKFCYTDEALQEFTTITNTPKSLNYTLTQDQYNSLSNFGKSVWDVYSTADMAYPYSTNQLILDNQTTLDIFMTYVTDKHSAASVALEGDMTAGQYFNGILTKFADASRWNTYYSKYFN